MNIKRMICLALLGLAPVATLLAQQDTQAQRQRVEMPTPRSSSELVRQLNPTVAPPPGVELSVALQVPFEFGRAELTPQGRVILDLVAQALNDPGLIGHAFLVEGHTDSVGSEESNLRLSKDRAASAYQYLLTRGVHGARLYQAGFGELRPIPGTAGEDGRNRRVEFVRLP